MPTLLLRATLSLVVLTALMAGIVFLAAGTWRYPAAWSYLVLFLGASALVTANLMRRDRALLERRLHGGPQAEQERSQQLIMSIALLAFVALLAIPGLDHRFNWSSVPRALQVLGDLLLVIGFALVDQVYRVNSYTAGTIRVEREQGVVSTGPYGVVRHPMYAGALLYVVGTPLALGSWWGFIGAGLMVLVVALRLLDEERVLVRDLAGYEEYMERVRSRLVPGVW